MGTKTTILGSAIALITIVVLLWIQSASPIRENDRDAAPIAKEQRTFRPLSLRSPSNDRTSPAALSSYDAEFVQQLAESDARSAAYCAVQLPATSDRLDTIKAVA